MITFAVNVMSITVMMVRHACSHEGRCSFLVTAYPVQYVDYVDAMD